MQKEIWKDVVGFEEYYQVSNLGNIKSVARFVNHPTIGFKRFKKEMILKASNCLGYLRVELYANRKSKGAFVHRIVAMAFIPNYDNKPQVNHINGVKTDNRLDNLEWVSEKENTAHAMKTGLRDGKGVNNWQSKLTESDVIYIRNSSESHSILALKFNVSKKCIYCVKKRKTYFTIAEQNEILAELKSRL